MSGDSPTGAATMQRSRPGPGYLIFFSTLKKQKAAGAKARDKMQSVSILRQSQALSTLGLAAMTWCSKLDLALEVDT